MPISLDEVHRLAAAARLALTPHEADALRSDLDGMLRAIDALPPSEGEPGVPIPGLVSTRLRHDLGTPDMLLLPPSAMAPVFGDGMFLVPRLGSHSAVSPSTTSAVDVDGGPPRVTGRPGRAGSRA